VVVYNPTFQYSHTPILQSAGLTQVGGFVRLRAC
jgi:hypothetical protein